HKMPDSYGNAVDYFDENIKDGALNPKRGLVQYTNPSRFKPEPEDILIFKGTAANPFGHVALITQIKDHKVEVIQQNPPPPHRSSRTHFKLRKVDDGWKIENGLILGRLGKKQ